MKKGSIWINLWLISIYVNRPSLILVIRLFIFARYSGVFTLKFSLFSDQQISFGINKFILMALRDRLARMMR